MKIISSVSTGSDPVTKKRFEVRRHPDGRGYSVFISGPGGQWVEAHYTNKGFAEVYHIALKLVAPGCAAGGVA